jgi:hypothetical protein
MGALASLYFGVFRDPRQKKINDIKLNQMSIAGVNYLFVFYLQRLLSAAAGAS